MRCDAIRRMYRDVRPARFRAVAGLADGPYRNPNAKERGFGLIDLWIFVDGQLKMKREQLRVSGGTVKVDLELGPSDRFLTLVATDGGNGIGWDCVVVGEPVLEMTETDKNDSDLREKNAYGVTSVTKE